MYKIIPYKISTKATILSLYLFALLFLALYGRQGFQTFNQVILWGLGPMLAFYILEPNLGRLHTIPREYLLYISMVVFAFLGYLNVIDVAGFYRYLQVFIANFILMIIIYFAINNIKEWNLVWKMIWMVGLVVCVLSFFFEVADMDEYYRLRGFVGNANGTANYARVGIIAGLINLEFYKGRIYKIIVWASIIFFSYVILLTASRGTFVNLVFILGSYFAIKYFYGWRLVILLLFLFIFGNLIFYLGEQFLGDFYLFERLTRNDSVSAALEDEARFQLYSLAWKSFLEYPILGVGLNQFHLYSEGKISHTDILDISVQLGVFAAAVYVSIYVRLFRKIMKLKKYFTGAKSDVQIYQLILICFISTLFLGFSNPNWFSQMEIIVTSLMIVYVTKIRSAGTFIKKEL
jgi:hypothetical protein